MPGKVAWYGLEPTATVGGCICVGTGSGMELLRDRLGAVVVPEYELLGTAPVVLVRTMLAEGIDGGTCPILPLLALEAAGA
jgi:hypothetical protein